MEEVVVIGGGAGGLNAALVLARARRQVMVVDSGAPRNAPAQGVHGFLSRDGMPPAELVAAGRAEVERYGGRVVPSDVRALRVAGDGFEVELAEWTIRARRVIVATGLRDELPELPGIRERWGKDVLHCPYCHGWEVRGEPVGVLGTRPESVHQALLVRQWSDDVVFFAGTLDEPGRAKLTARGVRIVDGRVDGLVVEDDRLRGVRLADGSVVERSALFVAPTFVPNDVLLTGLGCARVDGWVAVDPSGRTSVAGVWAVGNVVDPRAQVVTAAAAGATAAAAVNLDLIEEEMLEGAL
ncbi:thioredoxin reductase (NADPH) [Actinokineospora alba]|uniref:Thioredoxin reductase (NADPH) n=1 Tax=Actinokineospora alba TaxID=504798 RepID=A0A1H0WEF7_9PSEU|nr:NAD(P)/FAD-dependent oxidoreductase [Actinokineospora alba]TDP68935.1 thioredoxin reductase (NADPH) [Actinokineospora alba]SDI75553.1 thioredoxin reductase (NADPH) [Actinokineospora alba]SDP89169.1 thioredoxin reductase (NADPH) [Actinokineospora alba]